MAGCFVDIDFKKSWLSLEGVRRSLLRDWKVRVLEGEIMMSAWVPWSLTVPIMGMGSSMGSWSGLSGSRSVFLSVFTTSLMCVVIFGYSVDFRAPIVIELYSELYSYVLVWDIVVYWLQLDVIFWSFLSFMVAAVKFSRLFTVLAVKGS